MGLEDMIHYGHVITCLIEHWQVDILRPVLLIHVHACGNMFYMLLFNKYLVSYLCSNTKISIFNL